jgi:hypothetical protein
LKALLPFIVHCRYQPIGGRGAPKTGYVTFEREFDIREVATDEAPVVAEALNPDDRVVGRYRVHEGHFIHKHPKRPTRTISWIRYQSKTWSAGRMLSAQTTPTRLQTFSAM